MQDLVLFPSHMPLLETDQAIGEKKVLLNTDFLHKLHRKKLVECGETFSDEPMRFPLSSVLACPKERLHRTNREQKYLSLILLPKWLFFRAPRLQAEY